MSSDFEEFIDKEYPQLNNTAYFDYKSSGLVSNSQRDRLNELSQQILSSPHSSEDQSEFDRISALFRKSIADMFSTSLINYTVIFFPSPQAALDCIFEGFPWTRGSHYIFHESFQIQNDTAILFAEKLGASLASTESSSSAHSLFCVTYTPTNLEKAKNFAKKSSGLNHILFDATQAAPFDLIDLSNNSVDFILLSMKKICGIELCPTLIRLDTAEQISPLFYGGGAVAFSCARGLIHRSFKSHVKRLENGTPPMINIFEAFEGLNLMRKMKSQYDVVGNVNEVMKFFIDVLQKYPQVRFKVNEELKLVAFEVDGVDANELRMEFIRNKVIFGIDGNDLVASFGIANRKRDVEMFDNVFQRVLNK
ncbi:MOSC N-terminal beta barrel domain containing protein [Histomonas meleagridis]|uniref:MOSC N-terminal beta barrel domain containing protein n=1 Tax=Histomonas meleagridis TaxID=135588 RepID=UPI00355A0D99|nr:MOSC N-terminal beta barrel domain containing protein [Histomonas meleagridis]KAH0805684.1 MOSC N-terminal beta barrel domain containing protein [Histomonas meleagridis]